MTANQIVAGSRMIASFVNANLVRIFAIGCCTLASVALVGAAKPKAAAPVQPAASNAPAIVQNVTPAVAHADVDGELLQETSPAAQEPIAHDHSKLVWMTVTAYCGCTKCCGPKARGLTASGRSIAYNGGQFVAADTKLFKFGTQLQIPGYAGGQPVEVIDRGAAIKGNHIDLFFSSHDAARQWGKKWMAVTVVE